MQQQFENVALPAFVNLCFTSDMKNQMILIFQDNQFMVDNGSREAGIGWRVIEKFPFFHFSCMINGVNVFLGATNLTDSESGSIYTLTLGLTPHNIPVCVTKQQNMVTFVDKQTLAPGMTFYYQSASQWTNITTSNGNQQQDLSTPQPLTFGNKARNYAYNVGQAYISFLSSILTSEYAVFGTGEQNVIPTSEEFKAQNVPSKPKQRKKLTEKALNQAQKQ